MANENNKINGLRDIQDDDPTAELELLPGQACTDVAADPPVETDVQMQQLMGRIDEIDARNKLLISELEFKNKLIDRYRRDINALQQTALRTDNQPVIPPVTRIDEGDPDGPAEVRMLVGLNGDASTEYVINSGCTSLGSSPDNDIQLKNNFVSRHHAQIVSNSTDCVIGDLNSTNGTFVNSSRIKRHALREGDAVTIGTLRFKFVMQRQPTSNPGQ